MRKFIIVNLIVLSSCIQEKTDIDKDYLYGSWFSLNDNSYSEFYFEEDNYYIYDIRAGNLVEYRYKLKNDSLFRNLSLNKKEDENFEFYSLIKKFDENQINFKYKSLIRYQDSISIENYIKGEIKKDIYDSTVIKRLNFVKSQR
ncbi:hypothetical protein NBT05_02535 [Aquimarina sp. ERC-38]|uniref:hypothetical protein n=1 Tax=Aquimarina sp. ERC-38 TaxID=2949996 RepID=UPI002246E6A9|nr:hypothetical protein [Aquimarina sp. ERC-38]UZO81359.1 hypothetical protein NBT05_02535 [Aquimarina sp. ERC-38]